MSTSLTLRTLPIQYVDVYTAATQDTFGNGQARTLLHENVKGRVVERGVAYFQIMQKGPVIQGKAQVWFDGDFPILKGHIVVLRESRREYMVIDVAKPRDIIRSRRVDHTKCILE